MGDDNYIEKEDADVESSAFLSVKKCSFNNKNDLFTSLDSVSGQDGSSNANTLIPGAFRIANPLGTSRSESIASMTTTMTPSTSVTISANSNLMASSLWHKQESASAAVRIETEKIVVATVVEDGDESNSRNNPKMKDTKKFIGFPLAILIAIVIALVLFFTIQKKQQPQPMDTDIRDSENNSTSNHLSSIEYSERRASLIEVLTPLAVDPRVFDPDSPESSPDRIAALEWLVATDPARLPIPVLEQGSSNSSGSYLLDEISETTTFEKMWHKLRQRFVLTLFFFATNGQTWADQYSFLSGLDECMWNSIHSTNNEDTSFYGPEVVNVRGVVCDWDGGISNMKLYWNNLTGTIPSEVSYFADTLREINIGGGSITGSIPKSFEKLKNLEVLNLNNHCMTGSIPERLSEIPPLTIISLFENAGLAGSLNGFCNGTDYKKQGMIAASADCSSSSWNSSAIECDCCICCNPDKFECIYPRGGGSSFLNREKNPVTGYIKGFERQCMSFGQKEWIQEECPCSIHEEYYLECSNCTADGARISHPDFENNSG